MTLQGKARWLTIAGLIAGLCSLSVAQQPTATGAASLDSVVDAMQRVAGGRPPIPYVLLREYQLSSANRPGSTSNVIAEVAFMPPSRKNYQIQKSSGNDRGEQVVRRLLDHEVEVTSGVNDKSALNRNNYDFSYMGETILDGQACYVLGLRPTRRDSELISGQAWVDKSSFRVLRIEGDLAKSPSWWLKKVHVKLKFADLRGNWLQTNMEAVAEVRIVGPHTLTSRLLDYRAPDTIASAHSDMPGNWTSRSATLKAK
jgi:hypothetical protein